MGIRTGQQYLDGLRDDREIWCDGERVKDVTTDPRFAGGAKTLAELYDLQHQPDLMDQMTYVSPTSGDRVGMSFIQPRTTEDLVARRKMFKIWNDYTCGMFGRSPDFMNVMFSSYAAAHEAFDTEHSKFGKNLVAYYEFMRENDLASTHALVSPQVDRSKAPDSQEKDIAARIVGDNDKGFIINGVRMLATLAAISDELMVMPAPSYPLSDKEEAKDHAFGFAIPVATPGLKLIARPSVVHQNAGSPMDYPLSERFDDSDCMILFDNVLVPWERTFIYRDIEAYNAAQRRTHTHTHTSHQFATKDLAKAEFMRDLAITVARSTNVDQFLHIQNMLAELIHVAEWVEACIRTSEIDAHPGPGGTVVPRREALQTVKFMFPPQFRRACEIIQTIGAGGLFMVPSFKMLESDLAPEIAQYFQAANIDSHERIRLFRLACDAALTSFSGRQQLYERYFAGDPVRSSASYANAFDKEPSIARITALLDKWEAELEG
ncbi:MAG: 4-hydroxyphenylacetate 3-monooxygenase, oxygenase component [Rhodospirillaceae bacterium]|jgi:4-hydroxyphenylacetate 3-monooxygenase|nr:4-hydroxyphenylacetate 3-monooxygenase, oxygenase component [Rhodospirillaceae bacterium]MBT5458582.1 4-hydroxyphenylacetate 3-monooxygenase, oxygenase component [Rhodospirillaceae bacterium]